MEAKTDAKGVAWAHVAYEAMAPIYDDFTAHHDTTDWLEKLLAALERQGLRGERLLDVGCGTGKSFLWMLERGWTVTACDISPAMLEVARAKAGGEAELSVADMRELPVLGEFDLVWALDDAVNYLLDGEELESALRGMASNLAPSGLLLFDLNTLHSYRTFFAETAIVETSGRRLLWRGQGSTETPPGSISESRFEVEGAGEPVAAHVHRQRHFPEAEVLATIERAGLESVGVFGHGFDAVLEQPLEELTHTKAIYIARRA